MRVMSIALDHGLLKGQGLGDVAWRLTQYGRLLEEYHQVVIAHRSLGLTPLQLSRNVWVYPTNGTGHHLPGRVWDAYRFAKGICEEHRIDVIQTLNPLDTGMVAYLLKRRYGVPIVLGVYGDYVGHPRWLGQSTKQRLLNSMAKWLLRRADLIKVMTPETKQHLVSQGIPEERIWASPIAADLDKFARCDPEKVAGTRQAHAPNGERIVLFVGRLVLTKNVPLLLDAIARISSHHPNTKLLLCGDGDERASLEQLASSLGIARQVSFLGSMTHNQLPNYYGACDLLVLPSDHEGFARVLLEAAMAGKPVVSTATAGANMIVRDGETGFLVPPRDPEAMAEKIALLLEHPELALRMGEQAKQFVSRTFTAETAIQDVIKMWEKARELRAQDGRKGLS